MVAHNRPQRPAPDDDAILKQAEQMQAQLGELSSRLLRRLGLRKDQVADVVAQLERHPVRGKQVQQVRRLVSRLVPDTLSRRVLAKCSAPLPRGLRA
ncbi:MAG TPA: hypothetical protein VGQ83_31755 [Polyangia bacterium]|jgi:hypothetical protein